LIFLIIASQTEGVFLPFSLAELIIVCFSIFILYYVSKMFFHLYKDKNKRLETL